MRLRRLFAELLVHEAELVAGFGEIGLVVARGSRGSARAAFAPRAPPRERAPWRASPRGARHLRRRRLGEDERRVRTRLDLFLDVEGHVDGAILQIVFRIDPLARESSASFFPSRSRVSASARNLRCTPSSS